MIRPRARAPVVVQSGPMRGPATFADPTLDALLDEVYTTAETDPEAALVALDDAGPEWAEHPEVLFCRGELVWTIQGPEAAQAHFERAIAVAPEFADARYELGEIHGLLGEDEEMVAQNLEVLRLDAAADLGDGIGTPEDQRFIAATAEEVLANIPEEFRARLANVPLVLEARPARTLVAEGFDPRALGLFEGADDYGQRTRGSDPIPTRIVLFYANLLASFPDEDALREEIEVTILHEVGHFFGLDEADMERLGLE
jgi:predicted Zn-dependent protease with MMP-like domain